MSAVARKRSDAAGVSGAVRNCPAAVERMVELEATWRVVVGLLLSSSILEHGAHHRSLVIYLGVGWQVVEAHLVKSSGLCYSPAIVIPTMMEQMRRTRASKKNGGCTC